MRWFFGTIVLAGVGLLCWAYIPSEKANVHTVDRIVIDPGHGGKDPGNLGTGRYNKTEKDVVLNVSKKLGYYIKRAFPDVEVIYTREKDSYPKLHERTKMANREGADLFISVHCDAFKRESAKGSSSFVMGPAKTEANLRMAKQENAAILQEENYEENYGGFDPNSPEGLIELSMRQNAFIDQSLQFASLCQDQFRERVGRVDRGVRQAPYWVICYTTMPSVLVELGFLTNKEEEDFLQSEIGQDYMASAIYRAFKKYKKQIEAVNEVSPEEGESEEESNTSEDTAAKEEAARETPESKKSEYGLKDKGKTEKGITFKVQIMSSSSAVAMEPSNFNGLTDVEEYFSNGSFKYTTGSSRDYERAAKIQAEVRKKGFPGAFVVAFENGERVNLQYAKKQTSGKK